MSAATAASATGGVISGIGSLYSGQMTANTLNAQANLQEQNALEVERQGAQDAVKSQMIAGQKIGTIEADFGASGVTSNSGSVIDVLQASHANAELDRLNILHGADVRSIMYQNQAALNRFGGQSALQGSYFRALGSVLGGGGNIIGNSIDAGNAGGIGGGSTLSDSAPGAAGYAPGGGNSLDYRMEGGI